MPAGSHHAGDPSNASGRPLMISAPHFRLTNLAKRVADGIRTRDRRDHNAELYQLSYSHLAGIKSSGSACGDDLGPAARMRLGRLGSTARELDLVVDRALAQEAD